MKKIIKSRLIAVAGSKVMVLKKVGRSHKYTLPGGIKKRGETEEESLLRETSEEIYLQLSPEDVQFFLFHIKSGPGKTISRNYYSSNMKPIRFKIREKHKFEAVLWLEWKKAIAYMDQSDRWAIKAYFKNIAKTHKNKKQYGSKIPPRLAM